MDAEDAGPTDTSPLPPPPPADPPTSPSATPQQGRSILPWIAAVVGVLGLALAGVFGVLYFDAAGERDDLQAALTATEADLAEAEQGLAAAAEQATELEAEVAAAEAELATANAALAEAEASNAATGDELADAEARVAEAEERLDEAHSELADMLAMAFVGYGVDQADADCVSEAMVESDGFELLRWMAQANADQIDMTVIGPFAASMGRAAEACGLPADALRSPYAYGDDPELDALWDDCAAGSGAACDELYFTSPIGSEYELFGATCGERFDTIGELPELCEGEI